MSQNVRIASCISCPNGIYGINLLHNCFNKVCLDFFDILERKDMGIRIFYDYALHTK